MTIEYWKSRGGISFVRNEQIIVKDGNGKPIEKITCLNNGNSLADAKGDYIGYKMQVVRL